jgi:radical SAM superfamily enzyme YgiQ (UPF0313 family)
MNVILCYPPKRNYPGYGQDKRWLPLGIASLGAYIRQELPDLKVTLLDLFEYSMDEAFAKIFKSINPDDTNILGFTCFTEQRNSAFELCKRVKSIRLFDDSMAKYWGIDKSDYNVGQIITVVGGPHAFIMANQIAEHYPYIDHIMKGEGERSIVNLIKNYIDGRESKRIIEADIIHNLDELPHCIDGFDLFANVSNMVEAEAPIIFSRGCTDYCSFCSTTKFWHGYRSRSAENVFAEMMKYNQRYGTTKFKFHDDASTADLDNWKRLCGFIVDYKFEYEITARADQFDDELIDLLARSGCKRVAVGIESGNENLRNAMNKRLDMDVAKANMKKLMAAGIEVVMLFIIGYPGETDGTIQETIDLIREVKPSSWCCQPLMIFPGTKVYRDCVKSGWMKDDYWLQDLPQPYYIKDVPFRQLQEWTRQVQTCMKKTNVLIAAPVRQNEVKFKLYIDSLNNLTIPDNVNVQRLFVLHNSEHLKQYLSPTDTVAIANTDDDYICDEKTHQWKQHNLNFVANIKNQIIEIAVKNGFDYVFFVDSDLILHPDTLSNLLSLDLDIVAEIFWTAWDPGSPLMPNAWDYDHYSFLPGTIEKYKTPGVYQCGGTGAAILINRRVFDAGVNYNNIPNLSMWGEDRHFSIRAMAAGYPIHIDTHYPAVHLYRESDVEKVLKEREQIADK